MAVVLRIGAEMQCEEAGCPDRAGGTITAPYATRCPKHKRSGLVTAPAALASALAKAH